MTTPSFKPPTINPMRVVGLMSGTSMDGVDAAYLETDGESMVRQGAAVTVPYGSAFRARLGAFITAAPERGASPVEAALEAELTDLHAAAVEQLLETMGVKPAAVDLIGFHGQTIWHRPADGITWQMGDGQRLADALGRDVAFDFRSADMAAGGQGAPLLPIYHAALAARHTLPAAILNVGGVANLTCVGARIDDLSGFDTGPGNGLIDDWVGKRLGLAMDDGGAVASKGRVHHDIVERLLAHPFFGKRPPKSLDRFAFSADYVKDLGTEDGAATLTAFTAASVARALAHCPARPKKLFVTGGGRHNPYLMRLLTEHTGLPVASVDEIGWNGDALEAQAFGYFAVRCLRGLPLSFPGTTGVGAPTRGGRIVAPRAQRKTKTA
jgi:anhydro-N-acetylmuramic acid kinase